MDEKTIARFWAKVDKRGPDECWEWTAGRNALGYGKATLERRTTNASRATWIIIHGEPAPGLVVRHKCDNPPCCNPAHLELGTPLDNVRDCQARGRMRAPRGVDNGHSRLTDAAIELIRLNPQGLTIAALARLHGVAAATISAARSGKNWAHVKTVAAIDARLLDGSHWNSRLSAEQRNAVRARRAAGESLRALARAFGVRHATIGRLVRHSR